MVNTLIDNTLCEIAQRYQPRTLVRFKRTRPKEFEKMKAIEKEINRLALGEDLEGLKKALSEYKELILTGLERIVEGREWTNC